jgi:hypothetical protein
MPAERCLERGDPGLHISQSRYERRVELGLVDAGIAQVRIVNALGHIKSTAASTAGTTKVAERIVMARVTEETLRSFGTIRLSPEGWCRCVKGFEPTARKRLKYLCLTRRGQASIVRQAHSIQSLSLALSLRAGRARVSRLCIPLRGHGRDLVNLIVTRAMKCRQQR